VVREGLLGRIVEAEFHYDRYRNYVEAKTWKEEAAPGVGILYNLGSHILDQILQLFGKPDWVDARLGARRPGGQVADFYDIRLSYTDKLVIAKSSYLVREQGPQYLLHGIKGSYAKFGIDPQEEALKAGVIPGGANWGAESKDQWGKLNTDLVTGHFEGPFESERGNYPAFYQNLYDVIRHNASLAVKPEESLEVIRLIEVAHESNERKAAIRF
jgi:scyllo-inositol 2-dehydrogenase (NADP+)